MIVKGSLAYTPNGRKRRTVAKKKRNHEFKELNIRRKEEVSKYPSAPPKTCSTGKKEYERLPGYTVSVAYNKGAYQVIPTSDIKYIGK
jgi:hypothetical protein